MNNRQVCSTMLLLFAAHSSVASVYDSVLHCSGRSTNWMTGSPATTNLTIVPAQQTNRPLWLGAVPGYDTVPLTLGVGLGSVIWDDGVLGVRRDRALQLTQPGSDPNSYSPVEVPLVILGFRRSPTGGIPLVLQIEVHKDGIPFSAWLPGRSELLTGSCEE
jgi:hypothetical protein